MARSRLYDHRRSGGGGEAGGGGGVVQSRRPPPPSPDLLSADGGDPSFASDEEADASSSASVPSRIKSYRTLHRNRPHRQLFAFCYVAGLTFLYGYGLLFGGREGDRTALTGLANERPAGLPEETRKAAVAGVGPKEEDLVDDASAGSDRERNEGTTARERKEAEAASASVELRGDPLSYENVRYVNAVLERKQIIEYKIRRANRAQERWARLEREEEERKKAEEAEEEKKKKKAEESGRTEAVVGGGGERRRKEEDDEEGREGRREEEEAAEEKEEGGGGAEEEVEKRKKRPDETAGGGGADDADVDVVNGNEEKKAGREGIEDVERKKDDEDDEKVEPGGSPLPDKQPNRPNLRGTGPFRARTNYRRPAAPSRFVPFLTIFTLCTLMRIFVNLLVASTVTELDSDDDEDDDNTPGGSSPNRRVRSGMRGLVRGGLLRNLRGNNDGSSGPRRRATAAGRERARARYRALVDRLNRQRASHGERPISAESLRLVLSHRDFDGNDYDRLLRFDEENGPAVAGLFGSLGATEREIGRCPRRVIENEGDDLIAGRHHLGGLTGGDGEEERSGGRQRCAVCLEAYRVGDEVRTIPCFHTFHVECIDPWLSQKAECPVCKHPAIG